MITLIPAKLVLFNSIALTALLSARPARIHDYLWVFRQFNSIRLYSCSATKDAVAKQPNRNLIIKLSFEFILNKP